MCKKVVNSTPGIYQFNHCDCDVCQTSKSITFEEWEQHFQQVYADWSEGHGKTNGYISSDRGIIQV